MKQVWLKKKILSFEILWYFCSAVLSCYGSTFQEATKLWFRVNGSSPARLCMAHWAEPQSTSDRTEMALS